MTEEEWLSSKDPEVMLAWIRTQGKLSERKARLFAVACCYPLWPHLDEKARDAIGVAERYADGVADNLELQASHARFGEGPTNTGFRMTAFWAITFPDGHEAARLAIWFAAKTHVRFDKKSDSVEDLVAASAIAHQAQCNALRCLCGNPFRPPALEPPPLPWTSSTLHHLAQAVYNERKLDFGALDDAHLSVLSDALEEAAGPAELVQHLRNGEPHYRGCFAIDLLLEREHGATP